MPLLPTPLPLVEYYRCINDTNRPADYVGDWPVRHVIYAGRLMPAFNTREPRLHLAGFWAQEPFGAFAPARFQHYTTLYLN